MLGVFIWTMVFAISVSSRVRAQVSASSFKMQVQEIRISTDGVHCGGSISVQLNSSPVWEDLVQNPTLIVGSVPPGTYKCVMINMGSLLWATPAANDGACVLGSSTSYETCRGGTYTNPNGTTATCPSGNVYSTAQYYPWVYFSTSGNSGATGSIAQNPPGLLLASPLVVTGNQTHTFTFNVQLSGIGNTSGPSGGAYCDFGSPSLSFN